MAWLCRARAALPGFVLAVVLQPPERLGIIRGPGGAGTWSGGGAVVREPRRPRVAGRDAPDGPLHILNGALHSRTHHRGQVTDHLCHLAVWRRVIPGASSSGTGPSDELGGHLAGELEWQPVES